MKETPYFKRIFEQGLFENVYSLREQRVPKNKPSAVDNKEHRTTREVNYVSGDIYDFSSPMETGEVNEVTYAGNGFIRDKEGNSYAVQTQKWSEDAGMYANCTPCDYVEIFLSKDNSLVFRGEQPFMSHRTNTYGSAYAIEKGYYLEDFCAKWEIAATEETKKNPFYQEMKSKGDVKAVSYEGKKEEERERKEKREEEKQRAKEEAAKQRRDEYKNAHQALDKFAGKTFCWSRKSYPGHENLQQDIESLGGFFIKDLHKNAGIDYLLVLDGDKAEKRLDRARDYGIKLLNKDEFEKMYQDAKECQKNCKANFPDQQQSSWKNIHSFSDIIVGQKIYQDIGEVTIFAKILGVSKEMVHPSRGETYAATGLKIQRIASEYDFDEQEKRVCFYPREDKVIGEPFFLRMTSRKDRGGWAPGTFYDYWVEPVEYIVETKRHWADPDQEVQLFKDSRKGIYRQWYKSENWEEEFQKDVDKEKDFFAKQNAPMGILGKRGDTETTTNASDTKSETSETKPETSETKPADLGTLEGKYICFTGKVDNFNRKELYELAVENGAHPMPSVKQGCNYLVMADKDSTSSKAKAAKDLEKKDKNFRIITPEEFFNLIAKK